MQPCPARSYVWARKWVTRDYRAEELDPGVLMWSFEDDVDVCMTDPGRPVTIAVTATLRTLVDVLMGDAKLGAALREGLITVEGERELRRKLGALFELHGPESYTGGARPLAHTAGSR